MKTKIYKNANYIGWVIIILIIILIYFSYFFIYIPKQKSDLTQRAFRILKEYGNNMVGKHDYYKTHFKNYGVFYSLKWFQDNYSMAYGDTSNVNYKNINKVVQGLFPFVLIDTSTYIADTSFFYSKKDNKLLIYFHPKIPDAKSLGNIKVNYGSAMKNNSFINSLDTLLNKKVVYKVPIDDFMVGLKFDELFENISVFDNASVFYNSNLDNLADITNPKPLADSINKSQGGIYKKLNIRGKDKHAMIIPIDFDGKRFFIAGLIKDDTFKNITRTFNNWALILIAGVLLLVFVGMPILKTMFIGPKERLNVLDVSGSALSILFGSALFVLIIMSLFKHQFVDKKELTNRIEMISDSLYSGILNDIESIKILGNTISQKNENSKISIANSVIKAFDSEKLFFKDESLENQFPLNEIILIDKDGIVKKAYTRTAFSDAVKINLGERQYFKNAVDTSLAWPTFNNNFFYLESIQSYNTGKGETAISFHTTSHKDAPVLAITSEIPSLYNQVLPKDIQFVVINKTGKILYHSKKSKNLHENFIEECESDPGILNAVKLRIKDKIHIKYNEKKWLARIVPVKDTPLFHITLLDLNQTDNKNARIFLITFYFMIGLQILTVLSFILLRLSFKTNINENGILGLLKRLSFHPSNFNAYIGLIIILTLIATAGIFSFVTQADLVHVLLLQFLNVGFTFFASFIFLNRSEIILKDYFKGKYFPENLILLLLVVMIIFFVWKIETDKTLIIPITILLITILIIPLVFRFFINKTRVTVNPSVGLAKLVYLVILFYWLAIFSVIPVLHSYFSVKYFEEKLWQKQQLFKVAENNQLLLKSQKNYNSPWLSRIQGNNIDNLSVSVISNTNKDNFHLSGEDTLLSVSENIYAALPDPINNGYSHRELLAGKEVANEWKFKHDTLYFPVNGGKNTVLVSSSKESAGVNGYYLLLILVFLIVFICIWYLVRFAAKVFLNLENEFPTAIHLPWLTFFKNPVNSRILLKTFNGGIYQTETEDSFKSKKNAPPAITIIQAVNLIKSDFKYDSFMAGASNIIWICGLNECIPDIEKHSLLLDLLADMNHERTKQIIVELPFEVYLIDEFYNDYISENELSTKDLADIFKLRKKWNIIFKDYIHYNGFLLQTENIEKEIKLPEIHLKNHFKNLNHEWIDSNIWKNLTNYEKIVLYDLAEDGLMNRNNKRIIVHLTEKRLILFNPYPVLFSNEFKDFVFQHISKSDIKTIENKLGLIGRWKNAKYVILMILIPLAAFIFISQGYTIEKSFGIFAGIVGAITGLIKLLEISPFKAK